MFSVFAIHFIAVVVLFLVLYLQDGFFLCFCSLQIIFSSTFFCHFFVLSRFIPFTLFVYLFYFHLLYCYLHLFLHLLFRGSESIVCCPHTHLGISCLRCRLVLYRIQESIGFRGICRVLGVWWSVPVPYTHPPPSLRRPKSKCVRRCARFFSCTRESCGIP